MTGLPFVPGSGEEPRRKAAAARRPLDPARAVLQQQDLERWRTWKHAPTEDTLRPLLDSLDGVVQSQLRYAGMGRVDIPPAALETEALRQTLLALNTFNPRRGASIATHVTNRLKKLHTYVLSYQNVGRLPGNWGQSVGPYRRAKEQLEQELGREPSAAEISAKSHLPLSDVEKLERSLRSSLSEGVGGFDTPSLEDFDVKTRDVFNLIYPELSPQEQVVFEHTTGFGGRPILPAQAIAQRLNVPPYRVSRLRKGIAKKMEPYL